MKCLHCEHGYINPESLDAGQPSMCDDCYNDMVADVEREHREYAEWLDNLPPWKKATRAIEGTINRTKHALDRARH